MEKLDKLLDQIDKKIKNGKTICAARLVEHCKSLGVEVPKLYRELHKSGKMRYLR